MNLSAVLAFCLVTQVIPLPSPFLSSLLCSKEYPFRYHCNMVLSNPDILYWLLLFSFVKITPRISVIRRANRWKGNGGGSGGGSGGGGGIHERVDMERTLKPNTIGSTGIVTATPTVKAISGNYKD